MELDILLLRNPWWKGKENFDEDEDYRKWVSRKIKWVPELTREIALEPFSLHFIVGARQVGKTTAIKLLIKDMLELEKVNPKSIFYFRCDEISDYKELKDLLSSYLELRDSWKIDKSYIFLDEVSFPKEWYRTVKSMIDDGMFKNDVLILTASTSIKIKKETEYFPGRRGKGRDFVVRPLSFREFIKTIDPDLYSKLPQRMKIFNSKEIEEKALKASIFLSELNKLLFTYFEVGGFPLSINSYFESGYMKPDVKEIYLSWIKNDLIKIGKSINTAREVIKTLLIKIPSTISWETIAKETSIKSPKTVNSYLHTFSDMFTCIISYFLDPSTATIKFAKNKKVYLQDPLLLSIFEDWCLIKIKEKEPVVAESVLASHLARVFNEVYHWKNRTEIDCVVRDIEKVIGFECKWKEKIEKRKIILGKLKEIYILSKKELDVKNKIIPLSVFLALI
ncbi:MAG: ATP-binding protein [Methanocellales archaeon]